MSEPTNEPGTDAQQPYQEPYQEPTPEQLAERAVRANKATRGALAGILGLEAVVTLLVPRAIAFTTGLGLTRTLILVALAVLMIVAAGLVRRPFGIGVGSVLQLLFVLTGILLPAMFVVGAIFAAIWGYLLSLRHELVGTPGGWRLLVS
ncbi:MAG TPA: DUF4233 domain-containing protein [Jatrophihabitantaceae bacterium]|nr:DUF4233 domain-containing protein [Jatrophihabitantaceae bacterium]